MDGSSAFTLSFNSEQRSGWYLPVVYYGTIFLGSIATAVLATQGHVADASSQIWSVEALDRTLGLVSIFTMLFVTCLAFFKVQKNVNLR